MSQTVLVPPLVIREFGQLVQVRSLVEVVSEQPDVQDCVTGHVAHPTHCVPDRYVTPAVQYGTHAA
jgi:hypothetical protein